MEMEGPSKHSREEKRERRGKSKERWRVKGKRDGGGGKGSYCTIDDDRWLFNRQRTENNRKILDSESAWIQENYVYID